MGVTIERLAHPEPGLDVKHAIQSPDTQKTFFDKRLRCGGGRRRVRFDPDSLRAGPGLRVARRERTER